MALSTGSTLGPYAVIAKIGAGGMGEVFRLTGIEGRTGADGRGTPFAGRPSS